MNAQNSSVLCQYIHIGCFTLDDNGVLERLPSPVVDLEIIPVLRGGGEERKF